MRRIDYVIFAEETRAELCECVKQANREEGWVPTGGVAVEVSHDGTYYYQAMIRELGEGEDGEE